MANVPLTAASWSLGRVLAARRRSAGVSVQATAEALRVTQPTVSRIEHGRHRLTERQLIDLCHLLDIGDSDAERLDAVRVQALQPDWRQEYSTILDGPFGDVLGLEHAAERLRVHEASFVPGLLQIEEYAHAVMSATPYVQRGAVESRVSARMRRQEGILSGAQRLIAVFDWSALNQEIGGPAVMRRQIQRLLEVMDQESTIVRVTPPSAGAHAAFGASFTIMDFPDEIELPRVVSCDTLGSAIMYEQPDKVEIYTTSFDMVWAIADRGDGKQNTIDLLEKADHAIQQREGK